MSIEAKRFVLRQHQQASEPRIDGVGQYKVDDAIIPAKRDGRLGAIQRQWLESRSFAASQNDRRSIAQHSCNLSERRLKGWQANAFKDLVEHHHNSFDCRRESHSRTYCHLRNQDSKNSKFHKPVTLVDTSAHVLIDDLP